MSESYNQLFDEQDLLEDNNYQQVYLGQEKEAPHSKVLIHKFQKSDYFNHIFKELIDSLQNKRLIDETDSQIILVTRHLEGDNISLHLNFSNVTTEERLDYLYEYLHQAVAYIGFDPYLFNILISSNQIVFKENHLCLKEKIIVDRKINYDLPFSMVAKNMGQVMQRILVTNYNELRTSIRYDKLYDFTESLLRREKDYTCFDDLFNDFKKIYFSKTSTKKQVLMGENHPNNIFVQPKPDPVSKAEISHEVTEEERALLTGNHENKSSKDQRIPSSHKDVNEAKVLKSSIKSKDHDDDQSSSDAPMVRDEDEPFEESLDLSRLSSGVSSLEDLFVKKNMPSLEEEKPAEDDIKDDQPVFGVPDYMKEDRIQKTPERKKKRKYAIPWTFPVIGLVVLAVVFGSVYGILSFFNRPDDTVQPPLAKFEASFSGNTLICKNLSVAYNGATITESLWVISKDGRQIDTRAGAKAADFKVTGLTEGVYTIKLTVTDSNDQFSDPVEIEREYISSESKALENKTLAQGLVETNYSMETEKLDLFEISSSENVLKDTEKFYDGTYAYSIDTSNGHGTISFNGLDIPTGASLSFWIMNTGDQPIEIQISGFKNGLNNFDKTLVAKSNTPFEWKSVSVQLSLNQTTDNIIFRFPQGQENIMFDDLMIQTFK